MIVLLVSCNQYKRVATIITPRFEIARKEFVSSTWTITYLQGRRIRAPGSFAELYIDFNDDGRVQGYTGCNRIEGRYELGEGSRVQFDSVMIGSAACDEITYEDSFLMALMAARSYNIDDGTLTLSSVLEEPLAVFYAYDGVFISDIEDILADTTRFDSGNLHKFRQRKD